MPIERKMLVCDPAHGRIGLNRQSSILHCRWRRSAGHWRIFRSGDMDRFWETEVSEMKKNAKVVIGCSIVAAVCFGIVSYGHFYRGRMGLGWVFAVLTVAQLALAVMNYSISKKMDQSESVSEDTE